MHISQVANAVRVGEVVLSTTHDLKLAFIPDPAITKDQLKNPTGRVYFLTVDGIVKKIGGSQSKDGIQGTIAAYLGGFAQGMSPRSYCGWNFCRQQIQAGCRVEFWMILAPMTRATIPTMSGHIDVDIAVDFHQIESACVEEYVEKEGRYPELNIQESGRKWKDTGLLEGYPGIIDTGV